MNMTPFRHSAVGLAAMLLAAACLRLSAADADVVINELMYHPPRDLDELQYVELFNRGNSTVDLSKWSFTKGIRFEFPGRTMLAPGDYLVVCRNLPAFVANYGSNITAIGDFAGKLSHAGEQIELSNAGGQVVDAISYADEEPWPVGADGYAPSLERICPFASGRDPANWSASLLPPMERIAGTPGRQNDSHSTNLPPEIANVEFTPPAPNRKTEVTAEVADTDGVRGVTLLWRVARSGGESPETEVALERMSGEAKRGRYRAAIEPQPTGTLVRFRLKAEDGAGTIRWQPGLNEPRPTYSFSTFVNSNQARIPFAYVLNVSRPRPEARFTFRGVRSVQVPSVATRGNGAFIYAPPESNEVLTFDHVYVRPRNGGFKVSFQGDRPFKDMTGINVIREGPSRWMLAEPLAYEVYRLAGVPASLTEHLRVWMDGRLQGYQLMIEQPNKAFLARNKRPDGGNLYKLLWYGQGITGQHEKKTNPATGHDDLVQTINRLHSTTGAEQWEFIQSNFNVDECTSYFAVNMCIQNWDGFHNNYFTYHDLARTGKWEIYPWDQDKTWGDYDGASSKYDWYEMPLTLGMRGDQPPRWNLAGGANWWRPGGWFAAPLLANPEFRRRFLARLDEMCQTVFTEEKVIPLIDALEKRLEPEFALPARVVGEQATAALQNFRHEIQSFRHQVKHRRKFILSELPRAKQAVSASPTAR